VIGHPEPVCEYCGCQAVPTIDELTREHEVVLVLLGEIRAAGARADVPLLAGLARQVAAVLGPHTRVEEDGLFPAMAADFGDHITGLRAEHRQVEAVLDEAADGVPADPGWPARLPSALDTLREHIYREQDGLFPAALATLSTAEWETAEAIRADVGTLLPASAG
jgi:hemerythrin-like domain-containing protein